MIINIQFVSFIIHYGPCKSVDTTFMKWFTQKKIYLIES